MTAVQHDLAPLGAGLDPPALDLRGSARIGRDRFRRAGDEMAECLERFLTARADERTMQRAQAALLEWYGPFT